MGGPGSGPKKGGGTALPKNKRKVTIGQAAANLQKEGYELGPGKFDHKTQETSYQVRKGDKVVSMTASQIKSKMYGR